MRSRCWKYLGLFTTAAVLTAPLHLLAQSRLEREGVVLYWGLLPASIAAQRHALEEMHGTVPEGGQLQHLVVAIGIFGADTDNHQWANYSRHT